MNGDADRQKSSVRRALVVQGVVAVLIIAALAGHTVLQRVVALYPDTVPAHPFFDTAHVALLYVVTPVVVAATIAMLLTPGMLLILAFGGEARAGSFILKSFGAAFGLRVLAHTAAKLAGAAPLTEGEFAGIDIGLDAALGIAVTFRALRGGAIAWPFATSEDRRRLLWSFVIPALLVAALMPLFFWQDLTDDGLEALASGRSLIWHAVPRFPNASGYVGLGIGMLAMAFPTHWFVELVGPVEAAARLPLALYLPVLYAVIVELVEWRSSRPLRAGEETAIVLALGAYAAAMCFNSSYSPYAADISSPGASFETLTVLCIGATALFLWRGNVALAVAFAVLGYLARPTELLFLGLMGIAAAIVAGEARRAWLTTAALGIAACITLYVLYERIFLPHIVHVRMAGYGSASILARLQYLTFTDWRRFLYVAVPGGLLPVVSLLAWRRQDKAARFLTICCVLYFLFFYVQSFVALHHFVPVMILPIVVFWRIQTAGSTRWVVPVAAALAVLCIWAAVPPRLELYRTPRRIGREFAQTAGDGLDSPEGAAPIIVQRDVIENLFAKSRFGIDPAGNLVLTRLAMLYYAERFGTRADNAQYLVAPRTNAPPSGMIQIAADSLSAVFVRDTMQWAHDLHHPPPIDFRSPFFAIPRTTLFPFIGIPSGDYDIDLVKVPVIWRIFGKR